MIVEKMKKAILKEYFETKPQKENIEFVKFEDVAFLKSGQDLTSDRYFENKREDSIPYLTGASNLINNILIINRYTERPTSIANKNDILLTCKGTIGNLYILDLEKVHIARQFMSISCKKNIMVKYMFYYIAKQVPHIIKQGKSIIPGIKRDTILKLLIPLPKIEEQRKIVDKIEELFNILDEMQPLEEELIKINTEFPEKMKKAVLEYALKGKLSDKGQEWNEKTLDKLCNEILTGNSIPKNIKETKYMNLEEGYNYIATKDLEFDNSFSYENGVKIPFDEPNFKYADVDDILMCIEGGSAGKKIGILEKKVCYGNKLCKFAVSDELNPRFLYYYLQSPVFLKNFYDNLSGIIGGVSISKIRKIKMKYPDIKEQKRIADKLDEILPLIDSLKR